MNVALTEVPKTTHTASTEQAQWRTVVFFLTGVWRQVVLLYSSNTVGTGDWKMVYTSPGAEERKERNSPGGRRCCPGPSLSHSCILLASELR